MTPDPSTGFAARVAELCEGFVATGEPRKGRKSELLGGWLGSDRVIAKRLLQPHVVWDWYFAHERAVYAAFSSTPPPIRVPRLYASTDDVLVIERFDAPLARLRRPAAELSPAMVAAAIGYLERLSGWEAPWPADPLPAAVRGPMRQRLLEDPVEPAWVRDGLVRCHGRGWIDDATRDAALAALDAHAPVATCHGDLLLRNAMTTGDGELVLVDWECAGRYVADWDLALLWTQLADTGRRAVEAAVAGSEPRRRTFHALVVFALCREVSFLEAFHIPREHKGRAIVERELDAQATVLVNAS